VVVACSERLSSVSVLLWIRCGVNLQVSLSHRQSCSRISVRSVRVAHLQGLKGFKVVASEVVGVDVLAALVLCDQLLPLALTGPDFVLQLLDHERFE